MRPASCRGRTVAGELSVGDKLAAAFMAAFSSYPYFSSGLALLVRQVTQISPATMAVTRDGIILVDPRFVAKYEVRQLAEVLVHELSHLLRDHAGRSDLIASIDHVRWNVAADCEINCGLRQDFLPGSPCLPRTFDLPDGLLAEEYYDRLPTDLCFAPSGVTAGECGSGSGGVSVGGEPPSGGHEGRSAADISRARREVAAAVVDHAEKGRGNVPGDLLRWARGELRPPKVKWREVLRRHVRSGVSVASGKVDYDWSRPGRRQAALRATSRALGGEDVVLPSLRGRAPRVAVGVDTSASMGDEELRLSLSEVEGVLRAVGTSASFLACDSQVSGPLKQVRSAADASRCLRGGGGTDFRPVLEAVERMRPRPSLFVFMTDGDGPAPESPPAGVSVLWVLVGKLAKKPTEWGEHVVVKEDPDEESL